MGIWNFCVVENLSDKIHSVLLFLYICGKTLRCDYKTSWEKRESLSIIDNILSKCWGIKAVFCSVNFFLGDFSAEVLKKGVVIISKQLSWKHSCESVIPTFLKSRYLIDVFLGIFCLFLGVFFFPGIHLLWWCLLLYCHWFVSTNY